MLGKLDEAHEYCSRAIATNPLYAEAHNNCGVLYRDEGRIAEALQAYEACLRIDPHSRNAGQNRLLAMNSLTSAVGVTSNQSDLADGAAAAAAAAADSTSISSFAADADEQLAEMVWEAHRAWGVNFQQMFDKDRYTEWNYAHVLPQQRHQGQQGQDGVAAAAAAASSSAVVSVPRAVSSRRPLRIGYLSADFFTHSVSYFIEAPLAFADPARTHITCYSNVARRDKKTALLQSHAHLWRSVHDKSASDVAALIRAAPRWRSTR